MEENVNVVLISDNRYAKYLNVTIYSMLKNTRFPKLLTIYVIDGGIDKEVKDFIKKIANKFGAKIIFEKADYTISNNFKIKTHVSHAAYLKIHFPSIFHELSKIIYLDCDLILRSDIIDLWKEDISKDFLAAVENPFYNYDNIVMGLDVNKKTFNSGVMLINLKKWRDENIEGKAVEFLQTNSEKTKLHDQAAFNAVLVDKWRPLDFSWNVQHTIYSSSHKKLGIERYRYKLIVKNEKIIHFSSPSKPWQFRNNHPRKNIYKELYKELYEEKIKYNDIEFVNFLKKVKEVLIYRINIIKQYI